MFWETESLLQTTTWHKMAAPVVLYRRETWAFGSKKERKTEFQTACGDVKWIHLA